MQQIMNVENRWDHVVDTEVLEGPGQSEVNSEIIAEAAKLE